MHAPVLTNHVVNWAIVKDFIDSVSSKSNIFKCQVPIVHCSNVSKSINLCTNKTYLYANTENE